MKFADRMGYKACPVSYESLHALRPNKKTGGLNPQPTASGGALELLLSAGWNKSSQLKSENRK